MCMVTPPLADIEYRSNDGDLDIRHHVFRLDRASYVFVFSMDLKVKGIVAIYMDREAYEVGRPVKQMVVVEHKIDFIEFQALKSPSPLQSRPMSHTSRNERFSFAEMGEKGKSFVLCVLAMKAWLGLGRYGGTEKGMKVSTRSTRQLSTLMHLVSLSYNLLSGGQRKTAQKSKTLSTDIEGWEKNMVNMSLRQVHGKITELFKCRTCFTDVMALDKGSLLGLADILMYCYAFIGTPRKPVCTQLSVSQIVNKSVFVLQLEGLVHNAPVTFSTLGK
ncbi:hypothetical protein Tco_0205143 [Tanacetum coccineum]